MKTSLCGYLFGTLFLYIFLYFSKFRHYVCKYGAKLQVLELIADAVGDSEDHPVDNDGMVSMSFA